MVLIFFFLSATSSFSRDAALQIISCKDTQNLLKNADFLRISAKKLVYLTNNM